MKTRSVCLRRALRLLLSGVEVLLLASFFGWQDSHAFDNPSFGHGQFVRIENGSFYRRDQPWFPYGLNYWPEYWVNPPGGGSPDEFWTEWKNYPPKFIEADLARMKSLGRSILPAGTLFHCLSLRFSRGRKLLHQQGKRS